MRAVTSIILLFLLSATSFAHTHRKILRQVPDASYSAALAAANRFLHAWQTQDHETGIVMLTDAAREHISTGKLQSFFSPGPDAAYEIARGKRVNSKAYEFPVVLFNATESRPRPQACTIVVTRDGKSDWAVDKLP